jgi:peptide/nickel transport system permease protein
MINFTLRRIVVTIPVLFGILVVTFVLARLIPGDPCRALLGEKATQEVCDRFNHEKGLDQPIYVQFGVYVRDILSGDFGTSLKFHRPAMEMLIERLPVTVELSLTAFAIAVIIGIPAGIVAARYHNSFADVGLMVAANIGVSMPVFLLGILLIYVFSVLLKDTPLTLPPSGSLLRADLAVPFYTVYGWGVDKHTPGFGLLQFISKLRIFNALITLNMEVLTLAVRAIIMPAAALSTIPLSIIARMTRSSLLEVLGLDYVRTARAKGLSQRMVILKHAFSNALLPVVTIMGLQLGGLMAGAVLTETIFKMSGVGLSLYDSITSRDFSILQSFTVVIAMIYVSINLLVDLSYAFLDPRIRLD